MIKSTKFEFKIISPSNGAVGRRRKEENRKFTAISGLWGHLSSCAGLSMSQFSFCPFLLLTANLYSNRFAMRAFL